MTGVMREERKDRQTHRKAGTEWAGPSRSSSCFLCPVEQEEAGLLLWDKQGSRVMVQRGLKEVFS